jgi:hypothetical protein
MSTTDRKVIYLIVHPLNERDAERFGLAVLQNMGFQVEVWDVSRFFHPAASRFGIESPSWVNLTVCSSVEHFSSMCRTLKPEHVVIMIGGLQRTQLWQGRKLLRLISATPARLGTISSGQRPSLTPSLRNEHLVSLTIRRLCRLSIYPRKWKSVPAFIFSFMFLQLNAVQRRMRFRSSIRSLDYVWASTMVSNIDNIYINNSTKVTYIHQLDYDKVLALRSSIGHQPPRVVFIDSMGPLHPDYILQGKASVISIETYSHIICRGLTQIEERLGTDVVVAAHPRALPGVMEPWYGDRDVRYAQTSELVANATAVIVASGSAAIGMAVAFHRPLVLISSNCFDKAMRDQNEALSQSLAVPLIDLDASELPSFTLNVDGGAYAEYVAKYIKRSDTPEAPFWTVVAAEIISGEKLPAENMGA